MSPVRKRHEHSGILRVIVQAEVAQRKILNDARFEEADGVGGGREFESGERFFGHTRSPDDISALQNQHGFARTRQVGGGHEAVVPCSDDQHIGLDSVASDI